MNKEQVIRKNRNVSKLVMTEIDEMKEKRNDTCSHLSYNQACALVKLMEANVDKSLHKETLEFLSTYKVFTLKGMNYFKLKCTELEMDEEEEEKEMTFEEKRAIAYKILNALVGSSFGLDEDYRPDVQEDLGLTDKQMHELYDFATIVALLKPTE